MAITAIARDLTNSPNIVHVTASDTLAQVIVTDYVLGQADEIEALNKGEWEWLAGDIIAMQASDGNEWLQFSGSDFNTFVAMPVGGGVSTTLPSGEILVGSAGNVATAVAMTGDIAISNLGVTSIAVGAIVNADVNASAAIAFSKLATLSSGNILVGSAGNVATSVAMSGDATIVASGALTIAANAVTTAKILDANVTLAKLASGITPSHIVKFAGQPTTVGGAAAEAFAVAGVLVTDLAFVQIVDNGTGNVTALQAVCTADTLTVTFSGDPGNDCIFNYQILRAAS